MPPETGKIRVRENVRRILRQFIDFVVRENIHRILLIIVLLLLISTVGIVTFEENVSWANAFWWSIVTMTTVGYGDITPVTFAGRAIGAVTMLFGIGILGMFTATIASIFVERKLRENRGMSTFKLEDHYIICEWNHRAREVLRELRAGSDTAETPVALIAQIAEKPVEDEYLYFIRGDVNEENLKRANLEKARTVIILGDDEVDPNARDAQVVLSTLTVESINPQVYTIVELIDERNVQHCQRAHADEIIVTSEFSSHLIARSAMNHGISRVVFELLSSRFGNDLYRVAVPPALQEKPFLEVMAEMKRSHNSIVLAVHPRAGKEVLSNPAADFRVQAGDHLIVITDRAPGTSLATETQRS